MAAFAKGWPAVAGSFDLAQSLDALEVDIIYYDLDHHRSVTVFHSAWSVRLSLL
jgi:hypothetical protein